jgi:mRNA interferase MazF
VICEHWQVVSVPFPFMEKPAAKRRPALVISTKESNALNGHTVMAMITTAMLDSWPSDYALIDPKHAGLRVDCCVRWKIFTIANELIVKTIGELADEDRETVMIRARTILIRA